MMGWLVRLAEKKYPNKKEGQRVFLGIIAGIIGLLSNVLLFGSKLLIGFVSGSVSIIADAINNLSDTISSVLTLVGFYIAGKPADEEHPYGHERFEYISGLLVSLLIIFVGCQFLLTSVDRIRQPQSVSITPVVLVVLLLSILLKYLQGFFYQKMATAVQSHTLLASAKDSFNDVYTTLAVFLSAFIEHFTQLQLDGYIGFLMACYIVGNGIFLIRGFVNELMGARPAQEEIDQMKAQLSAVEGIVGYHDLLIHQYGPHKMFASVHIEMDDQMHLNQAHQIIDTIEYTFEKKLGVSLVCHVDPINLHDATQQYIHQQIKQIIAAIDPNLKVHDIRVLTHLKATPMILFDLVIPDYLKQSTSILTFQIQEQVYRLLGDYQVKITFDAHYLL